MSEFKGTKGQWTVTASQEYSDSVYIETENGAPTYGENEYNAQLIAHAPQMLEMLKVVALSPAFEEAKKKFGNHKKHWTNQLEKLIQQATTIK